MMTDAAGGVRLPHANSLTQRVPLDIIGRSLASALDDSLHAPLPPELEKLIVLLEKSRRLGSGSRSMD